MARYRLKLKSLAFISAVDMPAQETATARLLKRASKSGGLKLKGVAPVAKVSDELGLVFAWAWTGALDGQPYSDLHGDEIVDDDEMIKVAADFMSGARLQDEMHDRDPDGQVVFGMPMTPDIAKAFGIDTETTGFMVAIKPSPEVFAKFKSGELTGLSIDGTGVREEVLARKTADAATMKAAALTTDDEGHAHLIDLGVDAGTTSGAEMPIAGSSNWHSHPYVRTEAGAIEIGMAMGHTHGVKTAPVVATKDAALTDLLAASQAVLTRKTTEIAMTTDADRIKTLETELAKAHSINALPPEQFAFVAKLAPALVDVFLAKSAADRITATSVATEVIYKSATGETFTRNDDPRLVSMAKRADESDAARRDVELEKRADAIKHLPGTAAVRKAMLAAIDGITDEALRKEALAALAAHDKSISGAFATKGFAAGGAEPASGADAELAKRVEVRTKATGEPVKKAKAWLMENDTEYVRLAQQASDERRAARGN